MDRCQWVGNSSSWPYAKRCSNTGTVLKTVDGEELLLCPSCAGALEHRPNYEDTSFQFEVTE